MCRAATGIRVMATINHKACIVFGGQKAHMRRVQHRRFSNPFGDYLVGRCVKPWLFWLNPDLSMWLSLRRPLTARAHRRRRRLVPNRGYNDEPVPDENEIEGEAQDLECRNGPTEVELEHRHERGGDECRYCSHGCAVAAASERISPKAVGNIFVCDARVFLRIAGILS